MRPVQMADIEAAARAICAVAADERAALASEIYFRADVADRYRKRLRQVHPEYGTGSLMSAAAHFRQIPRPDYMGVNYLDAIVIMSSKLRSEIGNQCS